MNVTEHPTGEGKVYLAVVLDPWSRRIVGWSITDHIRSELVVDALQVALWRRRPPTDQCVAHADHGGNTRPGRSGPGCGPPDCSAPWARSATRTTRLIGWPHRVDAAHALAKVCTSQLEKWGVKRQWASGDLPTPVTYGIPDAWPHVRAVVAGAGFSDDEGHDGVVFAGALDGSAPPGPPPFAGLTVRREVDNLATRFTAVLDGAVVGYVNVQDDLTRGSTVSRLTRWCALRERFVEPAHRRRGVGTWLVGHAVEWLRLGGADRILVPLGPPGDDPAEFYEQFGWREIGRTRLRWDRVPAR